MKTYFLVLLLNVVAPFASANVCLNAESVEELKRDFPVVIVGKILKKTEVPNSNGFITMRIEVVRFLKGKAGPRLYEDDTVERFAKTRPVYEVGKEYAFPVQKYDVKTKGKEYDIIIPSQGCKIIPVEPK